jgi:hypothetical protein
LRAGDDSFAVTPIYGACAAGTTQFRDTQRFKNANSCYRSVPMSVVVSVGSVYSRSGAPSARLVIDKTEENKRTIRSNVDRWNGRPRAVYLREKDYFVIGNANRGKRAHQK